MVDRERRAGGLAHRRRQRRMLADLGALDVGDRRRRGRQLDAREGAEGRGRGDAEERGKPPLGSRAVEHVAGERRYRRQRAQLRRKLGVGIKRVGDDDFARLDAGDLGRKTGTVAFRHAKLARGDVDPGEREAVFRRRGAGAREREQVVVAPGIEQRILGQRAGGDQPHHVAADDAFVAALSRLGGIFKLLADGDTMAERDQPVQVFVGALDRNAAHRNVAAQMLAALGEHDAKRARGDFGVLEEQFVEITHPVEQETIRIGRLDLDILLHHRGDRLSRRVWSFAAPCGIALQHR